ncbi:MAG: energy transducer TonB, partial [Betaproteobacteria bacterium]
IRRVPRTLAPATLASLLVHAAIAATLAALVSMRPIAWGFSTAPLTVQLVAPPLQEETVVKTPAPEPLVAAQSPVATTPPPDAPVAAIPAIPSPASTLPPANEPVVTPTTTQASLALGQIRMGENYAAQSGLPEELQLRTQGQFLTEVDKLVRVVRNPDIVYPPGALEAKREGTVVVWLALSREGTIEETVIVSGEPEFAAAVEAGLPSATFLPAENEGQAVPFYLIMTFEFR